MKLIVGLGNPGPEYERTRHNIGFQVIDSLAQQHDIAVRKQKFEALYGMGEIGSERVILMKPQTFMNLSGQAVRPAMDFWKLELEDLLVLHDDLDFPLGTIRLVHDAGAAGHRGVTSIINELGRKEYHRIRLGVGRPEQGDPVSYVLSPFRDEESQDLETLIQRGAEAASLWVTAGAAPVQQRYHG